MFTYLTLPIWLQICHSVAVMGGCMV